MSLILYHYPRSGPSRFALLVARLLKLDIDVQIIDLSKKEQLSEDFVKVELSQIEFYVLIIIF